MTPPDFFHRGNGEYLEQLYEQYQRQPESLGREWEAFFAGFEAGYADSQAVAPLPEAKLAESPPSEADVLLLEGAKDMVYSYRELGHFVADLDPLGQRPRTLPLLELDQFGLSPASLDRHAGPGGFLGPTDGMLGGLLSALRQTYCGTFGVEYMDIADKDQREWLQQRLEPTLNQPGFGVAEKRRILSLLTAAETFEQFLHTRYLGQKRFSIEGAESLIPLLDTLIEQGASLGAEEIVMGMAHRGRLNVLAHILNKPYELILSEFEGTAFPQESEGDGDVKYHLGFSHDRVTAEGRNVHCSLSYNPSHLELVDPVIEGIVRAKQERLGDVEHSCVVPILIHGEAAFTGQGIVPETLNLSELQGYRTGGTIHIIVNNQVGFTASPRQTRFTPYPTDVAKMIQAPIFHVNGDDPEAVVHAARLAIAFRQQFKVDVMIDLWCYRRRGHNEADDPTYTQPQMYKKIAELPTVTQRYAERLQQEGSVEADVQTQMVDEVRQRLNQAQELARQRRPQQRVLSLGGAWQGLSRANGDWSAKTAIPQETLQQISARTAQVPEDFSLNPKLKRVFAARSEMAQGTKPIDWGCAEMWAIGSLLLENTPVRLVGQDSERGTFSHRHAALFDFENGNRYVPLQHLSPEQARFTVINTMLSEMAVLGFEYGYSSADPHTLVMWEAQFGDFVNGAQPIIDQFLASAESKWQRMSGLVMLLPHGYEGQGPEHSSARLERFLQLCAENNIQVVYPTEPAQYFHLLRRQMRRNFRKPLVMMSPKSLLRDDRATSSVEDFTDETFHLVIDDPRSPDREEVRRLIFCTGKVFYTLDSARQEREQDEVAIVRIEQLYPFPQEEVQATIAHYPQIQEVCWVQEEPRNMGAWTFIEPRLRELLPLTCGLTYVGRDEAASPAPGNYKMHEAEEQAFIQQALELAPTAVRVS
jgi:2-oxoglutarate dehydrogenase E1 component